MLVRDVRDDGHIEFTAGHPLLRQAVRGDEPTLRRLRLAAMTDSPEAFGSTYEREAARTVEDWARWLSPGATFLMEALTRSGSRS